MQTSEAASSKHKKDYFIDQNPHNFQNVQGQTVVITGGGSGLGRAMALDFASRKAKVAVIDVNRVCIQKYLG